MSCNIRRLAWDGNCIAIGRLVAKGLCLDTKKLYRDTAAGAVAGWQGVSQYTCCIVTRGLGAGWARRRACMGARKLAWAQVGTQATRARGARKRQAAGVGNSGVQACRRARARGASSRARQARGRGATGAQGVSGLGAGREGWPWAVHSVHSAYFRSVLTRFFFLSH